MVISVHTRDRIFAAWVTYNLVFQCVLPLLGITRVLGLLQPAYILYVVNPLFVLYCLVTLHKKLFVLDRFNVLFCAVFTISFALGLKNGLLADQSNLKFTLSHSFQLILYFVLFNTGRIIGRDWDLLRIRKIVMAGFYSVGIATVIGLYLLQSGVVDRHYTPAYGLLLPAAFFIAANYKNNIFYTFILALVSNKRAVVGALFAVILIWFLKRQKTAVSNIKLGIKGVILRLLIVFSCLVVMIVMVFSQNGTDLIGKMYDGSISAYTITSNRLERSLIGFDEGGLSDVSKDRTREVEYALNTLESGVDYMFGKGVGWNTVVIHGRYFSRIQNIHLSPLSIYVVFGPLGVFLIYGSILYALVKTLSRKTPVDNFCFSFVLAAFIHSFGAYSLFIDANMFLIVGMCCTKSSNSR